MKAAAASVSEIYHRLVNDTYNYILNEFPNAGQGKAAEELYRRWCLKIRDTGVLSQQPAEQQMTPYIFQQPAEQQMMPPIFQQPAQRTPPSFREQIPQYDGLNNEEDEKMEAVEHPQQLKSESLLFSLDQLTPEERKRVISGILKTQKHSVKEELTLLTEQDKKKDSEKDWESEYEEEEEENEPYTKEDDIQLQPSQSKPPPIPAVSVPLPPPMDTSDESDVSSSEVEYL